MMLWSLSTHHKPLNITSVTPSGSQLFTTFILEKWYIALTSYLKSGGAIHYSGPMLWASELVVTAFSSTIPLSLCHPVTALLCIQYKYKHKSQRQTPGMTPLLHTKWRISGYLLIFLAYCMTLCIIWCKMIVYALLKKTWEIQVNNIL